jgi:hypothetical protein
MRTLVRQAGIRALHTARMADWFGMIGNGVSALLGAGIGGYAAWKAACKAGEDASALARAERQADALDRRAELARGKAMDLRTVVAESLIHLNNLDFLYRQVAAKRMERQDADRFAGEAKDACARLRQGVLAGDYFLPAEVRSRLSNLTMLVTQAVYTPLSDQQFSYQRAGADTQTYGRYVRLSLQAIVHERAIPPHLDPPVILRNLELPPWVPDPAPEGWTEDA